MPNEGEDQECMGRRFGKAGKIGLDLHELLRSFMLGPARRERQIFSSSASG